MTSETGRNASRIQVVVFMRNHVEKQCVFTVFIYILAFSCEMLLNFTPRSSLIEFERHTKYIQERHFCAAVFMCSTGITGLSCAKKTYRLALIPR